MADGAFGLPGGPAFPVNIPGAGDNGTWGMSLRDWFAGQAIRGLISEHGDGNCPQLAERAYGVADAMIAARDGRTGERE